MTRRTGEGGRPAPARAVAAAAAPERPLALLLVALAAALPALALYAALLHPGVPAGDSGELIAVAATGGVAHPPGYPLWTMLAGLWLRALRAGEVAWRLNLFSAVAMAGAAALLALAVRRFTGSRAAGVLAAWAFAAAGPALDNALVAEVFALNALLGAAVLLALAHAATAPRGARTPAVAAIAFLGALALSHHHTLLLLALPAWAAAFALAAGDPAPVTRVLPALPASLQWAALALAPLAWLPFAARRAGALAWGEADTPEGFLAMLLRSEYGTFRLDPVSAGMRADTSHVLLFARALPEEFGVLPLVLAAAGAAAAWGRSRAVALALAGFAALQAWFFTRVGFPSDVAWLRGVVERFYILPLLALAFLAGCGAAWVLAATARRRAFAAAATLLLAAAIVVPAVPRAKAADQRGNTFVETLGRGILASLPPGAVLFVQGDLLHNALACLTRVEGLRPDVTVLDQELMTYAWYVRGVRAREATLLPPFARAQRVWLRDGRVLEGLAVPRPGGTVDVLAEHGQATLPARDVVKVTAARPESLYAETRAGFRDTWPLPRREDRYSGLPGTRNLLWLDHLAGRRPVAFLGAKDQSFTLRWQLAPRGFATLARRANSAPEVAAEAAATLAVLDSVTLEPYFRAWDPSSFEAAERWRFAAVAARAALLCCRPEAAAAVRAHPRGHARLLEFAARFEALEPTPDPECLRAAAFLRVHDPAFRDLAKARANLERYLATGGRAARDDEARALLERVRAATR